MKEYNERSKCEKCGYDVIKAAYTTPRLDALRLGLSHPWFHEEAIKRTCERCGYSWNEEPIKTN